MDVLITGGTGTLGSHLTKYASLGGDSVRILSRRSGPGDVSDDFRWVQGDLGTGDGLTSAVDGVDVVFHLATSPGIGTKKVDVEGTRRLVNAAEEMGVNHFIYLSIVGIDRIPYSYYQHKLTAESIVESGSVPHTILRATQFHELIDLVLSSATKMPLVTWLPKDFQVQSIAASEVAQHLYELSQREPAGRVPDIGGPEVRISGDMIDPWLEAQNLNRKVFSFPFPGEIGRAFREGKNTCPDRKHGTITWEEWLQKAGEATAG